MRFAAPSGPYFFSSSSRKNRKATAGSVVVPDLEMTFTEKSTPSSSSMVSRSCRSDRPLPTK